MRSATTPIATEVTACITATQPLFQDGYKQTIPCVTAMVQRKLGGRKIQQGDEIHDNIGGKDFTIVIKSIHGDLDKKPLYVDRRKTNVIVKPAYSPTSVIHCDEEWSQSLTNIIESSFRDAQAFRTLGMPMAKSVLVHGVAGIGKDTLVRSVCQKLHCCFLDISIHDLLRLKDEIDEPEFINYNPIHLLITKAINLQPSIAVVRHLNSLQTVGDANVRDKVLKILENEINRIKDDMSVCVVGLAQELKDLPNALQKTDIFSELLHLPIPTMPQRTKILQNILSDVMLEPIKEDRKENIDYYTTNIGLRTSGYIARDLKSLCRAAKLKSIRGDLVDEFSKLSLSDKSMDNTQYIKWADFAYALSVSRPSQQMEIQTDLPKRSWAELGGYVKVKKRIKQATLLPLLEPQTFSQLGIKPPSGLLLYGPSGCGKTAFVQALSAESMMNVMCIRGPEIFSKYLGETESKIRRIFATAKRIAPCILFIDEMDAISARRGWESGESSGGINERVLSTLLNEMDGVEGRQGVIVIGCTNQPDQIDDAILRPGRLDQLIYMGLPDKDDRKEIIKALMHKMAISPDMDIELLSNATELCTGADIENVFREAGTAALRRDINTHWIVQEDLRESLHSISERAIHRVIHEGSLEAYERFNKAHRIE